MIRKAVIKLQERSGDPAARRGLCDALHDIIRAELLAFATERSATDATQEALVKLFSVAIRKAEAGEIDLSRSDDELKAYFKKISLNALRDARKRERLSVQRHEQLFDADRPAKGGAPSDVVAAGESRTAVRGALARLDTGSQELLKLWLEGLSSEEIASRLCVTPGAARARIHRAKRALRALFDA